MSDRPTPHDETPARPSDVDPVSLAESESDLGSPPTNVVRHGGTFESFRHRAYALFWSGALVSNVGTWMQNYALTVLVYSFRSSELDLGIVNFVSGIPTLLFGLYAGALADRVDRRKLIIWAQAALMVQAAVLGTLYSLGRLSSTHAIEALLWVAALGFVGGTLSALTFPSWQAMLPDLVPRPTLLNAIALNSAQFQSARLLGPLVAGAMMLAGLNEGHIFWVNAASFLFVIGALAVVRPLYAHPRGPAGERGDRSESPWRTLTAGVRYARHHRSTALLITSTGVLTIFGMAYMMLLPAVVDKSLLPQTLNAAMVPAGVAMADFRKTLIDQQTAFLMAANGTGAVFGALVVASLSHAVRRERLVRWTYLTLAVALIGFGLSRNLYLSLVISSIAGAGVLTTNSLINTSIQAQVPHELRGRVLSLFIIAFMGLMPFSAIIFGVLGKAIGPSTAIIAGAVVLLAYAAFLLARPDLLEPDRDRA
jgi:MFS family permease